MKYINGAEVDNIDINSINDMTEEDRKAINTLLFRLMGESADIKKISPKIDLMIEKLEQLEEKIYSLEAKQVDLPKKALIIIFGLLVLGGSQLISIFLEAVKK
jgi:hypothetical protein